MSTNAELEALLSELETAHDDYLRTLTDYESPSERKETIERSIKEFGEWVVKLKEGTAPLSQGQKVKVAIQAATEKTKYPKGSCSTECFNKLILKQHRIIAVGVSKGLDQAQGRAIIEMTMDIINDVMGVMLMEAASTNPPWKSRETVHNETERQLALMEQIENSIREGRIMTIRIGEDKGPDSKSFLN